MTTLTGRSFCATLTAVIGAAPFRSMAQDLPTTISIGSTAPGHLKFMLYRNLGLLDKEFAKEGMQVDLVTFDGGSAASVALGSGALDIMYTGNNPTLRLAGSGADVNAVGLSRWNPLNDTMLIVQTDSTIAGLKDLAGKNVAYRPPGPMPALPGRSRYSPRKLAAAWPRYRRPIPRTCSVRRPT